MIKKCRTPKYFIPCPPIPLEFANSVFSVNLPSSDLNISFRRSDITVVGKPHTSSPCSATQRAMILPTSGLRGLCSWEVFPDFDITVSDVFDSNNVGDCHTVVSKWSFACHRGGKLCLPLATCAWSLWPVLQVLPVKSRYTVCHSFRLWEWRGAFELIIRLRLQVGKLP